MICMNKEVFEKDRVCVQCGFASVLNSEITLKKEFAGYRFAAKCDGKRCNSCGAETVYGPAQGEFERRIAASFSEVEVCKPEVFRFMRSAHNITRDELCSYLFIETRTLNELESDFIPHSVGSFLYYLIKSRMMFSQLPSWLNGDLQKEPLDFEHCPKCDAVLKPASGGGVICSVNCGYWFCF